MNWTTANGYRHEQPDVTAVHLVAPCERYREQYYEVQAEYLGVGEEPTFGLHFVDPDFTGVLQTADDWRRGANLPPGEGRRRVLWLVRDVDDKLLGTVNIRSLDTEYFTGFGGNIGYSVRPSERRKRYATRMLALALEECRKAGLQKVLVTCHPDNAASRGAITKNGGVPEGEVTDRTGERYLRFWIDLGAPSL